MPTYPTRFLWPDAAKAHTKGIVAECTAAAETFRLEEERQRAAASATV